MLKVINFLRWAAGRLIIRTSSGFTIIRHPEYRNTFHGYYDVSCFNPKNPDILLLHVTNASMFKRPDPTKPLYVVVWDRNKSIELYKSSPIYSWNWQQGARATWVNNETIIYNTYDTQSGTYRAIKVNIMTGDLLFYKYPVQSICNDYIVSIDYAWMSNIRRDYGYFNRQVNKPSYGLILLDFKGQKLLELPYDIINKKITKSYGQNVEKLKVNHVLISDDCETILFLIRYFVNGERITDLAQCSRDGNWSVILRNCNLSHYCFVTNDKILASISYKGKFGWAIINLNGKIITFKSNVDGHPFKIGVDSYICDTSPSKFKVRYLYKMNESLLASSEIFSYREYWKLNGEIRVDMHPTASKNGANVQVDLCDSKHRFVGLLNIP